MTTPELIPEPEPHAQELAQVVLKAMDQGVLRMTRLLASKPAHQVLGPAEFQVRDIGPQIGAQAVQAELDARPKKATKGRAFDFPRAALILDFDQAAGHLAESAKA